jgi:chromosome segregation ATPase
MAQDFHAAFAVGEDDRHITEVDEGGVALAAIQGLNQKLNEKDAEIQTLKRQNDSLAERLNKLEAAMKQLTTQN